MVLCEMWMVNRVEGRPLDFDDVAMFDEFAAIPNDHDRIIAITARRMDTPLITTDGQIIASGLVKVVQ